MLLQGFGADIAGEQDHRQLRAELPFANRSAQNEAALIRKLGAEDHQIGQALFQLALRVGGALRHGGGVPGVVQHRGHAQGEVVLLLDDEDAAFHRGGLGEECTLANGA